MDEPMKLQVLKKKKKKKKKKKLNTKKVCFALVLAWKDFTNDLQPIFSSYTLREKCPYFPAFRLNTERYFSRSERDKPIDVTAS